MQYLSPVDAAFRRMESGRTPMHIGALMTFALPLNASPDFLRDLLADMRSAPVMPHPFGSKLSRSRLLPAWIETPVDIDYHIRHSALPYPGGERELGVLVERLHSNRLDFGRPLWECHLIEGLEDRRFALYFKAHHCAIDGMGAMQLVRGWLKDDPQDRMEPRLSLQPGEPESAPKQAGRPMGSPATRLAARLRRPFESAAQQVRSLREIGGTLLKMSAPGAPGGVRDMLSTPRSLFNQRITRQRRLGTQILDLRKIKSIAARTGTTVNDVVLAICGGAMRRYLLERDALPKNSLVASVPVGLPRAPGKSANAAAGFVCPLGTDEPDPVARLRRINAVTGPAKDLVLSLSPQALEHFTLLGLSPFMLGQMTGVLAKLPPLFNVTVSNVIASKQPLYLRGAELQAIYPMSFLFDGYALNITLVGYRDQIAVGFIGCRDAIPSLQKLAVYTRDELAGLERAACGNA